jgi:hypothetical protein
MGQQLALLGTFVVISGVIDLPFTLYQLLSLKSTLALTR